MQQNQSVTIPTAELELLIEGALAYALDRREVVNENAFGDYTEVDKDNAARHCAEMLERAERLRAQIAALNVTPAQATPSEKPTLEVSLDGGETYVTAREGVRIMYGNVQIPGEDELGDFHVNATHEGLILDVWVTREGEDYNIGTEPNMIDEMVSRLVEAND